MRAGSVVLVGQRAASDVPSLPGVCDPGRDHILMPLVVLVLVKAPFDKEEGKLLACEICNIEICSMMLYLYNVPTISAHGAAHVQPWRMGRFLCREERVPATTKGQPVAEMAGEEYGIQHLPQVWRKQ